MKKKWILVALLGAALGTSACSTMQKAPECKGKYSPINGPEHYPQERK